MADSNWMFGTDNYQPTNFSVDDWVNELKTKANQAYENISPKDNSDSIVMPFDILENYYDNVI